jgi:hypothetical protein
MNGILGTHEAVVYFRNYRDPAHEPGYVLLAPYTECRAPRGYDREVARTIPEIVRLQDRLREQELRAAEAEVLHDQVILGERDRIRSDELYTRMVSGSTTPYERDYIRELLKLRDKKKREKYATILSQHNMHLHALEMDAPKNRSADSERVSLDRINF